MYFKQMPGDARKHHLTVVGSCALDMHNEMAIKSRRYSCTSIQHNSRCIPRTKRGFAPPACVPLTIAMETVQLHTILLCDQKVKVTHVCMSCHHDDLTAVLHCPACQPPYLRCTLPHPFTQ